MIAIDNRRRVNNGKPSLQKRTISHANHENVVPLCLLAPEIERIILKLNRELESAPVNGQEGGVELLAQRLAAENGHTAIRYNRRIHHWRNEKVRCVKATVVDRVYRAVGELHTEESVPIVELPAGPDAALEMVDVWTERERREEAEALDNLVAPPDKALATKLLHFSQGMCLGWDVIDLEIANSLELFFLG